MKVLNNKYDKYLFLLILSLIGGQIGGALQLPRVLSVFLIPPFFTCLSTEGKYIKPFVVFFVFWFAYNLISLMWTPDIVQARKEIVYYIVHPLLFLELVLFSYRASDAKAVISKSWITALILTLPIAIWELITNNHLYVSTVHEELYAMSGGIAYLHRNASVTFGNYNNYNVFICLVLPFIVYRLTIPNKTRKETFFLALLLVAFFIIIPINASRGTFMAMVIVLFVLFINTIRIKRKSTTITLLIIVLLMLFVISRFGSELFYMLNLRSDSGVGMLRDDGRTGLIKSGLMVLEGTFGFGCGMGGITKAMESVRPGELTFSPHNMLIELLAQYGIIIFIFCVLFLVRIYKHVFNDKDKALRVFLQASLLSFPFMSVVNSGYLLNPHTWAYMASLFIMSSNFLKK